MAACLPSRMHFHHGPQRHFRFAVAHIAAQQPVHGPGLLHVVLDFLNAPQLVVRFRVVKGVLKFLLPRGIRRKSKALQPLPLGIQAD